MVSTDRLYGIRTSVAVKPAVTAFATTNVTLYGEQTITMNSVAVTKTVTTTEGMRILLTGQDNPIDNGIWEAKIATWVRAPDFNGPRDVVNGTLVFSIYGDCWQVECDDMPVIIGTSSLTFRSTFPFSDIDDLFQRTLRVPESSVQMLPVAEDRKNTGLFFNSDGEPVCVDININDATGVFVALSSADGLKYIGVCPDIATLRSIEPGTEGQRITLKQHTSDTGLGGGQFRAVLDGATYTDNNGTVIKTSGGSAWLRINADVISPVMFGAVSDGVTNDTVAIQAAISTGARKITFRPSGTASIVNAGSLTLNSGQTLSGYGAELKHYSTTLGYSIFNAFSATDIKILGFKFSGPSSQTNAVNCVSCVDVIVRDCKTENIGLFSCKSAKAPNPFVAHDNTGVYSLVTDEADYSRNIKVINNTTIGDGTGILGGAFKVSGIYISYAKSVVVSANYIENHKEGVQWWGGDALAEGDSMSSERKCYDIVISDNTVLNTVGGIWGSMGQRVKVKGNSVINCGDVAIDFEGCVDCTASVNSTGFTGNGCLTVIGLSRNIRFIDNTALTQSTDPYHNIAGVYFTDTPVTALMDVHFENNTFKSIGTAQTWIKIENCPWLSFSNNRLENVRFDTTTASTSQGTRSLIVSDNDLLFTAGSSSFAYTAISIGDLSFGGRAIISGNKIDHLSSATAQYGISYKATRSGQGLTNCIISDNIVTGFIEDIHIVTTAPSSGNHFVSLQSNIFGTKGGSISGGTVVSGNNYTPAGASIVF